MNEGKPIENDDMYIAKAMENIIRLNKEIQESWDYIMNPKPRKEDDKNVNT